MSILIGFYFFLPQLAPEMQALTDGCGAAARTFTRPSIEFQTSIPPIPAVSSRRKVEGHITFEKCQVQLSPLDQNIPVSEGPLDIVSQLVGTGQLL